MKAFLEQPGASFLITLRRLGPAVEKIWTIDSVQQCTGRPGDRVDDIADASVDENGFHILHVKGDLFKVNGRLKRDRSTSPAAGMETGSFHVDVDGDIGLGGRRDLMTPGYKDH